MRRASSRHAALATTIACALLLRAGAAASQPTDGNTQLVADPADNHQS